jgi:glyoxylase-like metal-dependent hydrolase (beta-lactamase superfamily II)
MAEIHYECSRTPEQTLEGALATEGRSPEDVDTVILTHLHWDHCYNLDLFEHADIFVQREELEYAIAPYGFQAVPYESKSVGLTPPWLDVDLTPLEGETEVSPGVTVFPTPGHAIGHQSVEVESSTETVVLAGDAIATYENLEGTETAEYIPGYSPNTYGWWRSAKRIEERADRILPGHEPELVGREFDLE